MNLQKAQEMVDSCLRWNIIAQKEQKQQQQLAKVTKKDHLKELKVYQDMVKDREETIGK